MADIKLDGLTVASSSGSPTAVSLDSAVDIKGSLNATGSAPVFACRAWINFKGQDVTGSGTNFTTAGIRDSGNVSGLVDRGDGMYTLKFAQPMPHANYSPVECCSHDGDPSSNNRNVNIGIVDAETCYINAYNTGAASSNMVDVQFCYVAIFC